METDPAQITGLVLTYNGERLIEHCIRSLQFCDRILVVDSFSSDSTVEICRSLGAEVIQNPWSGPGPQFEFAFRQIATPWVFSLDQDEICTAGLRAQALRALGRGDAGCSEPAGSGESAGLCASQAGRAGLCADEAAGYFVRRKSWYYNRFMLHSGWYPDYLLRLFQPAKMRVEISGAHYRFVPLAATGRLSGEILHYPYKDFAEHLDKINSYASQGAADLAARGRQGGLCPALLHGLVRFIKLYFLKAGMLDGKAGFINAAHGAFYAFSKYLRVEKQPWGEPFDRE
ncbi:MAG: glycosyltransferase family 2 protein [Desulfovibrionaceae bacterium]|nr:glycosyltransferase family 2 protein [Desulfovibrionaceae bacterium]